MECHDDDVGDEMMSDGNGRRYDMAVGSSKVSYGSWFLFLFFPFLVCKVEDKGQW